MEYGGGGGWRGGVGRRKGQGKVGEEMKSEGGREGEGGITDVITLVLPTSYS